jgi:cell wall-associated NlpC family hydrolase
MKLTKEAVELTTKFAWSLVGISYKLGGNVPQHGGMDCSAFCLELLRSMKKWDKTDATAQQIHSKFNSGPVYGVTHLLLNPLTTSVIEFKEGDFLFFGEGTGKITHIAYAINSTHMLEAGGDDNTGMIRLRPSDWRKDMVAVLRFKV